MKWWACAGALLVLASSPVRASGQADAFASGQALGSAGVTSAQGAITAGQGGNVVPNYSGAAPESSYFAGGQGALFGPASGKVSNCASGPQASTAYGQQDCNAVNFLARNPAVRPQIAVGKNDPLVAGAKSILANPQALAGNMNGSYSACSTATVTQPAAYDTEVCNQYTNLTQSTCQKILTATVSNGGYGCTAATNGQHLTWSCPMGGCSANYQFYCSTDHPGYLKLSVSFAGFTEIVYVGTTLGAPSFLPGRNIKYVSGSWVPDVGWSISTGYSSFTTFFGDASGNFQTLLFTQLTPSIFGCYSNGVCSYQFGSGTFTFTLPQTTSIAKLWDNQCTTLEALAK